MSTTRLSASEFEDLVMRQMRGMATPDEEIFLRLPKNLFRWRRVLNQKLSLTERHIESFELSIERRRQDLGMEDDDDREHLSEEELDSYIDLKAEMIARALKTRGFRSYVADALDKVEMLIAEQAELVDPADFLMVLSDARDALRDEDDVETALDLLDEALERFTGAMSGG